MNDITVIVERPDTAELDRDADERYEVAASYVIDSPEMYEVAADELKHIKARLKELKDKRMSITRPMDAAKKEVMALFGPAVDRLGEAEQCLKKGMLAWQAEVEQERRRVEATMRDTIRMEREEVLTAAAMEREKGEHEVAAAIERDLPSAVPSVAAASPKIKGVSIREQWNVKVENKMKVLQHAAAGEMPMHIIEINWGELRKFVRALDGAVEIPGVSIFKESQMAVSSDT